MTKGQIVLTVVLMIASLLLFTTVIILLFNSESRKKKAPEKYNKARVSKVLIFSGVLLLSIWLMRLAVGYSSVIMSNCSACKLTPVEEIVNSLFKALRTFSLEEEYDNYIIEIKAMISGIVPESNPCFSLIKFVIIAYASLLNFIAPIVGGAIILEIISSIFPAIRLRWSYFLNKRPKYFFSELNAASLSLAKSIYNDKKAENPILIFTDTYVDDEKEKEYELLLEAKKYGAICLRDDLAHVAKTKLGERTYYLIDENEFGNLKTLMGLAEDHNIKYIKDSYIYLFVQSDAYVQVEKQINRKLDCLLQDGGKPIISPVNGYRNLVHNLFVDVPLYEPLINKRDNTKLNVTILGNGVIGTEAFLSAYWFGQMLIWKDDNGKESVSECDMTINVVSKDEEEVFWSKIDYVNPEIKETIEVVGNSVVESNSSKLLVYNNEGHKNKPYCRVRYIKADVKFGGFWDNSGEAGEILKSDYFIVALGNDADNISVADKLRCLIGKKHLEESADDISGNSIITYAVFNSELANTLNHQKCYQCRKKGRNDIYMHAFGSIEQVYCWDNVFLSKHKLRADAIGKAYNKTNMWQMHIDENKKRMQDENKNYTYWADISRAMHIKYKVFSLGLIKKSVFDYNSDQTESHKSYITDQCKIYEQMTLNNPKPQSSHDIQSFKLHLLAWLEHRRWNAFTRTMGFQYTAEFKKNLELNGDNHKNMELKLHPCLIESEEPSLDGNCRYLRNEMEDLFKGLDVEEFNVDELGVEQMLNLLDMKKAYLISVTEKIPEIQIAEFDLLDKLTYEWCKEATKASIVIIDDVKKLLQKSVAGVSKELIENEFKRAWRGVSCYDFKKYDYSEHDYK